MPASTGDSLGTNLLAGASEVSGLYKFRTGQRVLHDFRTYHVNTHIAHTDIPGHNFTGDNFTGPSASWVNICGYNGGFLTLQETYVHTPEDSHWSPIGRMDYAFTYLDGNGDVVWQRTYHPADLNMRQTSAPSFFTSVGGYSSPVLMAGNLNSKVLVFESGGAEISPGVFGDRYFWLTFDADGDFTRTEAFSTVSQYYSTAYTAMKQIKCGTGYIVFSQTQMYATTNRKVMMLDNDLGLVGSGLQMPGGSRRYVLPRWNGVDAPHFVWTDSTDPDLWHARKITYDGVTPGTLEAETTGNTALDTYAEFFHANSVFQINNWNTGAGAKPNDYWIPSDGGTPVVAPNHFNMEAVYSEDWTPPASKGLNLSFTIETDWYNVVPITSPYAGDKFSYMPSPVRFNFFNESTSTSAAVDVDFAMPADALTGLTYMGGGFGFPTLYDFDMDDAGYATANADNGLILAYTFNYWTKMGPQSVYSGFDGGNNVLVSYWIIEPLDGSTPPPATTMPSWWNAFGSSGSSGGGVAPSAEGDCARLGQGENVAFLYDRGGTRKIAMLPQADMGMIRWNRKRDDMSNCTMSLVTPGSDCCQIIREMQCGRHEIVVFRDGERVWEGPLTRLSYKADSVEVEAHDVMHYTSRTIMRAAYDNRYRKKNSRVGPVTKRAQVILQNELIRKERLGYNILKFLDVRTHPKTTRTSRYTPAYYSTVFEEMEYLGAKLSLDYTVIGRRIVVNDVHDILGRLQMLTDKDFTDELIVTSYGMELRTRSAVTDGEGHWAAVGGVDPYYGEVEFVDTTYGEEARPATTAKPTKEELKAMMKEMTSQAQRNLTGRYPLPTIVRIPDNTRLSPEAPVTINELIPGVRVPIRATLACLELEQEQKLDYMQVEQAGRGNESVTITLSPAPGSTPWDDSSETGADEED